jgi:hypothetical protein
MCIRYEVVDALSASLPERGGQWDFEWNARVCHKNVAVGRDRDAYSQGRLAKMPSIATYPGR